MNIARTIAVARKEFIQIKRDPISMALAFLLPLILLFIFGYAISMDIDRITVAVADNDKSSQSRGFVNSMTASGYFTNIGYTDNESQLASLVDAGKAKVGVVFPNDFSRNLVSGVPAPLQVIVDGADANTATIAIGYMAAAAARFTSESAPGIRPVIEPRVRVWYNEDLKSRNFIVPGLIAVILSVIAALLTSLTIAREWERGTMEQLISTPVKTVELVTGKIIPYFAIGFVDMAFSVGVAVFLFKTPLRGSVVLLMALSCVFLFGLLSLGALISIIARSQLPASQFSLVATFLPAFLLSGFIISIANMPLVLQYITNVIPARYFVAILKGIFLKGSGLADVAYDAFLLLVFGIVVFTAANLKFVKRIG
ncbi:MAG: ABC transporter permease [Nitrospinae bacterium]|nr:ABC transporter permease [Nitrospinota bacterium]